MRALQLIEDRRLETVDLPPPPPPALGEVTAAHQGGGAQPYRRLGLARHGLRQAQAAARRRRRSFGRSGDGRSRRLQSAARPTRVDLRRAHLRLCRACREGRDNLCEHVSGVHGFHLDGFAQEKINLPARLAGACSARRRRHRRGGRARHLRHGRAHAVRQRQAAAWRNDPRPCRRLRHRLRRDPVGQEDGLHRHHHGRLERQDRAAPRRSVPITSSTTARTASKASCAS